MGLNKDFKVKNGLTVTDNLSVGGKTLLNAVTATLFEAATATFTKTIVSTTSALSVINNGTGPALYVRQTGSVPIAQFFDAEGGEIHFADTGKVGIGTATPNELLTVNGNISAQGALSAVSTGGNTWSHLGAKVGISNDTNHFDLNNIDNEAGLHIKSKGDVAIVLEADTDNSGESDNPKIRLLQDGGGVEGLMYIAGNAATSNRIHANSFVIGNTDNYGVAIIDSNYSYINIEQDSVRGASNVGIHTMNPNEKLTVNGNISAHGGLSAGNIHDTYGSQNNYFSGNVGIGINRPAEALHLPDNSKIALGTSADLQMCHDGTSSYLVNTTGNLIIRDTDGNIYLQPKTSESGVTIRADSCVQLYYDNSEKLKTQSTGVVVTGNMTAGCNIIASGNICASSGTMHACCVCATKLLHACCVCATGQIVSCGSIQSCANICATCGITAGGQVGACSVCACCSVCSPNGTGCFGTLSKGSGSFKIKHPLESKKCTHKLVHSFIEGPKADNIYSGSVNLTSGNATVNIDNCAGMTEGTFVALNRDIRVFTNNESNWDPVKGSVSGNVLTVESCVSDSVADVSWMVIGERQDAHMYSSKNPLTNSEGQIIVEPEIPPLHGDE